MADVANQSRLPHAIVSVDASNCFDRVARPISNLSSSHFGLPNHCIEAFFTTTQRMKMCLLTAHGMPFSFCTGAHLNPFQGLIQGSGAVSPGFLIIAVLLIRSLHHANLIPPSTFPTSKVTHHLAGQSFADDSDFIIVDDRDEA